MGKLFLFIFSYSVNSTLFCFFTPHFHCSWNYTILLFKFNIQSFYKFCLCVFLFWINLLYLSLFFVIVIVVDLSPFALILLFLLSSIFLEEPSSLILFSINWISSSPLFLLTSIFVYQQRILLWFDFKKLAIPLHNLDRKNLQENPYRRGRGGNGMNSVLRIIFNISFAFW